jgi:hypothetical protein
MADEIFYLVCFEARAGSSCRGNFRMQAGFGENYARTAGNSASEFCFEAFLTKVSQVYFRVQTSKQESFHAGMIPIRLSETGFLGRK